MAEMLTPVGQKKMNWHVALIYFILWLMAFMDLFNGLVGVFGVQAAPTADGGIGFALHTYPDMTHPQIFILDGVFLLLMSMYAVFVRFQLAGFKRRAPVYLMILFLLNVAESIAFTAALYALVPDMVAANIERGSNPLISTAVNATVSLVTAGLTWIYYQRRKELFTK